MKYVEHEPEDGGVFQKAYRERLLLIKSIG